MALHLTGVVGIPVGGSGYLAIRLRRTGMSVGEPQGCGFFFFLYGQEVLPQNLLTDSYLSSGDGALGGHLRCYVSLHTRQTERSMFKFLGSCNMFLV